MHDPLPCTTHSRSTVRGRTHARTLDRAARLHHGRNRHHRHRGRDRDVQVAVPALSGPSSPQPGASPDELPGIVLRLRAAGCVFAEDEAALLVAEARDSAELEAMVRRRVAGLPLEHILGWAEFAGLRVRVDDRVFVPRRRTEFLAALAVSAAVAAGAGAAAAGAAGAAPTVLDLCCGSGAIALVVQTRVPGALVFAADLDPAAVRSARRNLARPDRVFEGDLFQALPPELAGRFDVIASNTPYVPTEALALMPPEARLHEARLALDGGGDGLDVQRRVAAEAVHWLAPGGRLLVEVNAAQVPEVIRVFTAAGLAAEAESSEEFEVTVVTGTL